MHIDELRALFGLSRATIKKYIRLGIMPPSRRPNGSSRFATYGQEHINAIRAYRALKDNNTYLTELVPFLKEEQISIVTYAANRERDLRENGLRVS